MLSGHSGAARASGAGVPRALSAVAGEVQRDVREAALSVRQSVAGAQTEARPQETKPMRKQEGMAESCRHTKNPQLKKTHSCGCPC